MRADGRLPGFGHLDLCKDELQVDDIKFNSHEKYPLMVVGL
jgi:hypothetical protein